MPQNLLKIYDGRERFWQFDTGQKLIVLDRTIDQIHFSNKSMTKAIIKEVYVDDDGVRVCDVPDMMLKMPHSLIAYSYVMEDDSNKTICMTKFSVSTRQIPEDYSYEENNRFKDLVDKIESVEDILESGTSIKRFNSLDEANAYVQDYKESGVLLSVWNGEEWALYMVAENYALEQIGDLDQLIADVEQLQILVGDEPVADQISHAILEQDLPNTYEKLGAAEAVRNELRDEVERAKFEEAAITRELHKINKNISEIQDDLTDANNAIKEISDDYLKESDKNELNTKIKSNTDAIALLTNGVDSDKIDSVNDLIEYVDTHGAEVLGMKKSIKSNTDTISAEKSRAEKIEGGLDARLKAVEEFIDDGGLTPDLDGELITVDDIDTICGSKSFSYDELGNVCVLSLYNNSAITYDADGNVVIS
jgi:hypothetical protein